MGEMYTLPQGLNKPLHPGSFGDANFCKPSIGHDMNGPGPRGPGPFMSWPIEGLQKLASPKDPGCKGLLRPWGKVYISPMGWGQLILRFPKVCPRVPSVPVWLTLLCQDKPGTIGERSG